MATPYSTIYERCLQKLTDYDFAKMSEYDLTDTLHSYMLSAIAKFRKCKNDFKDRDDELAQFNVDLEDEEIEILAIMIAREWLQPQLTSALVTQQIYSSKEVNAFSQSSHLAQLQALDTKLKLEAQKLSRDYTYANTTYFD